MKADGSKGAGAGAGNGRRADGRALYRPMLAESSGAPFSSDDWLFEVKWDGIRAISYVGPGEGQLSIRSRNGIELRWKFPELGELEGLVKDAVLDGEIVVMKDGRADFQAVLERMQAGSAADAAYLSKAMPATYVVFDILEKVGKYQRTELDQPALEAVRWELYYLLGRYHYTQGQFSQAVADLR